MYILVQCCYLATYAPIHGSSLDRISIAGVSNAVASFKPQGRLLRRVRGQSCNEGSHSVSFTLPLTKQLYLGNDFTSLQLHGLPPQHSSGVLAILHISKKRMWIRVGAIIKLSNAEYPCAYVYVSGGGCGCKCMCEILPKPCQDVYGARLWVMRL